MCQHIQLSSCYKENQSVQTVHVTFIFFNSTIIIYFLSIKLHSNCEKYADLSNFTKYPNPPFPSFWISDKLQVFTESHIWYVWLSYQTNLCEHTIFCFLFINIITFLSMKLQQNHELCSWDFSKKSILLKKKSIQIILHWYGDKPWNNRRNGANLLS